MTLVKDKEKTYYERIQKRIDLMKEFADTCDPKIVTAAKEALGLSYAALKDSDMTIDDILRFAVKSDEYENKFRQECSCLKAADLVKLQKKSVYPFRP
jgi:hypothetical protein